MKKEMSMETRLLLAFLLMGVVFMVTPYLFPTPPQPETPAEGNEIAETIPPPVAPADSTPSGGENTVREAGASGDEAAPEQIQAAGEETATVETDLFRVTFSNRGGVVKSWILKDYTDAAGDPLELVNQRALTGDQAVAPPFAIDFGSQPASNDPNDDLFQVQRSPLGVAFTFSDGRVSVEKSFAFQQDSYSLEVSSRVIENGVLIPHTLAWRGGFGDPTVPTPGADERALYYDQPDSDLNKTDAGDAPASVSGVFAFAGIEDKYFAAVAVPAEGVSTELRTLSDSVTDAEGEARDRVGAAIGGSGNNRFSMYVGPKDLDILSTVDPRLNNIIAWGFFGFIAQPLFYALHWTATTITSNYGWAIVIVTIVINTVLFPLRLSSMKSSRKMQALAPQVKALNEKYKGLSMKDPRKSEQNQELMDLYKKNDVNPVGGCLPMALQIPFFFALYSVLSVAIEMRGAEWLWVTDLSQPETLAIRVLPVILAVTQFAQQKMTPSPGMDPSQQKMMMFMPLLFLYMFYYASAGLVLYWLTSNIVSVAQQWVLNKSMPAPAVAPAATIPAPKKKKK